MGENVSKGGLREGSSYKDARTPNKSGSNYNNFFGLVPQKTTLVKLVFLEMLRWLMPHGRDRREGSRLDQQYVYCTQNKAYILVQPVFFFF